MITLHRLVTVLAFAFLATLGHAQQTWKVFCQGGPGVDFTDLPPAVAAAAPGDTIFVWLDGASACWPDPSYGYTAPVIDKPLNIVGLQVSVQALPPGMLPISATVRGVMTVTGLAAGQRVVLSNLGIGNLSPTLCGILLSNCQGEIIMEGCSFGSIGENNVVSSIVNCDKVEMHGCEVGISGTTLGITNSTVTMSMMTMTSNAPFPYLGHEYTHGVPAITLVNSTLTVTGSYIRGTDSYSPNPPYGPWFTPIGAKQGVLMSNSTLNLGPDAWVRGGYLIGGGNAASIWPATSTPGVMHKDSRATIDGNYNVPTVFQEQPATYVEWATANQPVRAYVAGPSDGFALLLLGDYEPSPLPTPFGNLLLDPNDVMFVDLLPLPASAHGIAWRDYLIPSYAQNGHAYGMQSLTLSPAGVIELGIPAAFAVAWENGRIP